MDEAFRILDDGRVYFDYGPASMVVTARRGDEDLSGLAASAFPFLRDALSEIAGALPVLRQFPDGMDYSDLTGLPRVMAESVLAAGEPTLTPMAAVAGTVADAVADWLFARGADLVAVNNGGDVALRLGEGRSIRMGILPDLNGRVTEVVVIRAEDGIGGVCTSGLGGRRRHGLFAAVRSGGRMRHASCELLVHRVGAGAPLSRRRHRAGERHCIAPHCHGGRSASPGGEKARSRAGVRGGGAPAEMRQSRPCIRGYPGRAPHLRAKRAIIRQQHLANTEN